MYGFLWVLYGLALARYNELAFGTNGTVPQQANALIVQPTFDIDNFQYKGIAIGGWLVLEPYITPSLFLQFNASDGDADIPVDEYHFCKELGHDEAQKQLKKHWDNFYTEADFADIKDYGLNMVRIPVGYWSFVQLPLDPYVSGAADYLDKAIGWAKNHDLKVMVDLHGVPGSQNGFDSSGLRNIGYPGWFNSTENVNVTYQTLEKIYKKYGSADYRDTIIGIELVNEPLGPDLGMEKVKRFLKNAIVDAQRLLEFNTSIVLHDAFQGTGYWNDFMNDTGRPFLIDHHKYEVFSEEQQHQNITEHMSNIRGLANGIQKDEIKKGHRAVVGEWSAALTDCTPWLNGVGLGSRYAGDEPYNFKRAGSCEGINNFSLWDALKIKNTRKFLETQLYEYSNKTSGWIFWCYKTEDTIEWDFKRLVEHGMMPQPFDNYTYIKDGKDTDKHPNSEASAVRPFMWFMPLLVAWMVI